MTPVLAALAAFALYVLGYRFYSGWLARAVFKLDAAAVTPAHALRDEVDYVPTRPAVLFGHHFASITGLSPMLGPAVAVIWGWLPALLWVVLGALFVGCVHDFAALVVSARHRGMSVGHVARSVLSGRAGLLFLLIIFFGVSLAMGVFVFVIARLFSVELEAGHPGYPQAVLPSALLLVVALISGVLLYRRGWKLLPVAAAGFAISLLGIPAGMAWPTLGLDPAAWPSPERWTWLLLAYAFAASVLPVWALLQARDFLNSLLLYLGLALAFAGFFVAAPAFEAPAFRPNPPGAPGVLPFVFIIVACGAASGFHGLVSSGTTAKQLDRETHARPIGYGGMIGESLLALLATLACTAGFASADEWNHVYHDWSSVQRLTIQMDAFIRGTTRFIEALGVPGALAGSLIALVVVSFALTTLDSATRLLRFNIEELGTRLRLPRLLVGNRWTASALACLSIAWFAFHEVSYPDGSTRPAALALWRLFGTTNQLLAGLTLVLVTVWLTKLGRPTWPVALPAVFMLGTTLVAMSSNLADFAPGGTQPDGPLFAVGCILAAMTAWLLVESLLALRRARGAAPTSPSR